MSNTIESAFMGAAGSIESLVRAIVRDELRKHLGPEAASLNVKNRPRTQTTKSMRDCNGSVVERLPPGST
jgi:hypothetical protein